MGCDQRDLRRRRCGRDDGHHRCVERLHARERAAHGRGPRDPGRVFEREPDRGHERVFARRVQFGKRRQCSIATACASRPASAASTRSGVKGKSESHTPVASWIAAATAAANGTSGISDIPRAPNGPCGSGVSMMTG